ncbi:MAG: Sensor protein FixL [Candidatus Accumulibacter regalis]|jgi:PAS domain S-box-containing protein|uniref:Sensor protein FixL n=2 Tax=Candidatus Accumulibacter TaxID=327159 RepID=A0A011QLC7_ACCRE|nr:MULTISPECIES: PAS domain S-box protein [unclassified Candidatus Accumulibacter]EXI89835.1 MAG: Sensor protein FixL [Candidatus Accumulibacter regalis]MQM34123.1 PAS sensor domain-containing protein [Candidatus Accumulibacter phosphatis]MBL8369690.1 PAS sensor domain-containing protein [Accumulibacter sp.]HRE70646.1 PAS domain S-box protein [Accumulibacter sp.]HRI92391.1 PAS domain S-box protein [Accumulibacter sp.]
MQPTAECTDTDSDLYRAIVDQAPDVIIFADRKGAIRVWNGGAETVFGHSAAEVLGESLDVIIPERLRKAHWDGFHKAIDSGQTKYRNQVLTTRSVHKDGSRLYVELSFGLVRDGSGTIVGSLAIGRDCTARHLKAVAQSSASCAEQAE